MSLPNIAVVGIHGHGATHVAHVQELEKCGVARLAATVDMRPPADSAPAPRHHNSLEECLETGGVDTVIVCTPINTHAALARQVLAAGCDLLLEKPTATSWEEYTSLRRSAENSDRLVQVGFQSLGSHAIDVLPKLVAQGEIGQLQRVAIQGTWLRPTSYWERSRWAGQRVLDGIPVVDGVVTNPLAHSFATALALLGCGGDDGVQSVVLDQYHVNAITADDTSAVRIETASGIPITAALTLCASQETPPKVTLQGSQGSIDLFYTEDRGALYDVDGRLLRELTFGRTDLLENLLEVRAHGGQLRVPLGATGGFMQVLEAVRTAPDPAPIAPEYVQWHDDATGHHPVLQDVERWVRQAALSGQTFAEAGAPWAR